MLHHKWLRVLKVELAKEARECMEKIRESSAEVAKAMS